MLSIIKSISLQGLSGYIVNVEVDVSSGIPNWEIVGLPNLSIRESKERVRSAIKNSGYEIYSRRITVNLSPADIRKEGSLLDLPIAIGVLASMMEIKKSKLQLKNNLEDIVFVGELSLNGKINRINGIFPICLEAKRLGINTIIVPRENLKEASLVNGIEILGADNLKQVISFLEGSEKLEELKVDWEKISKKQNKYDVDFSDIKGGENVKRALEIAAAGGHNCLLLGSPGSGKTLASQRIPTILPDLSFEEMLETMKIYSILGKIEDDMILSRPFRSPHHTITIPSLIGGGTNAKPGEISLAHNGVLFLDEFAEFNKNTLEVLRAPLEDKQVTISRCNQVLTYPCNFMLVAAMNPCPCGYYGSNVKKCNCSQKEIKRYISKISGPLLDRIDIQVEVEPVTYEEMIKDEELSQIDLREKFSQVNLREISKQINSREASSQIKARVDKARRVQRDRYKEENIFSNSELNSKQIEKYCKIEKEGKELLEKAFYKLNLSARAYNRILKVARTIADLEGGDNIEKKHLAEAIQYRGLDKMYY